jgi:hypothetical protein
MPRDVQRRKGVETLNILLQLLRDLPFVGQAEAVAAEPRFDGRRFDALVRIETAAGIFEFVTEIKRSYLDLSITRAVIAVANQVREQEKKPFLLFARYVPGPTGERLIDARVNFLDLAGNIHLDLEPHYHWTVLGRRERLRSNQTTRQTPATLQVLFTFVAHPESAEWTVRKLASVAGVSKSKAASARRQVVSEGAFRDVEGKYRSTHPEELTDRLLGGYRQVLRPHILIGRYRPPDRDTGRFIQRLRSVFKSEELRYALTGGPAAFELQRFYRGPHAPIFVENVDRPLLTKLRLLPDQRGPVTLLRAFGDLVFWQVRGKVPLADPWLIYAELMREPHPRAHEAAEVLRKEFLGQ